MSTELPQDIVKLIFEFVPKDRNCKSPIADLIHNDPYYDEDTDKFHGHFYLMADGDSNYKSNSFHMCRYIILKWSHFEDLLMNRNNDNYCSVLSKEEHDNVIEKIQEYKEYCHNQGYGYYLHYVHDLWVRNS